MEQLTRRIKTSRIKSAAEPDQITNICLRKLPQKQRTDRNIKEHPSLQHFLNRRKKQDIIQIPKAGANPRILSSYRPIILLSNVSKITEWAVLNQIKSYLLGNNPRRRTIGIQTITQHDSPKNKTCKLHLQQTPTKLRHRINLLLHLQGRWYPSWEGSAHQYTWRRQ